MPASHRVSSDTVDIGRGNHYEPRNPQSKPLRRSSTLRSDEWDMHDRSVPHRHSRHDGHRPRHSVVDVYYERAGRPVSYYDDGYYDRWQESSGPGRHYVSPVHRRHGAQSQMVGVRPRPRSPSPVYYDDDHRVVIDNKLKKGTSTPNPPIGNEGASKARNETEHIPGLFQTVFDVNHPQDASVHLELPITDNLDAELEEFCRLQRLGNFGTAEDYFNDKLEPYLSNPYVFVQYGQMLLEKGDYLAFERLNSEAVFGKEEQPPEARAREIDVVIERNRSRSSSPSRSPPPVIREREIRVRSPSRSRSRPLVLRQREVTVRSRSRSPEEDFRRERRARFESDARLVRRRSRSRSQSLDRFRYERHRDDESDRSQSPVGGPHFQGTKQEPEYDELELLRQNWRLLKATSTIHRKGDNEDAYTEAWYTIKNFSFGAGVGSTEIQVVKLALHLCANIARIAPLWYQNDGLREAARAWIDWPALGKELLIQGRIWDFKDFYVAIIAAFSDSGDAMFFGPEDIKRSLIDGWILEEEEDESTNLALLDMLLEPAQTRSYFPNETRTRTEAIIAHSPEALRSRSFIRWILANAADALSGEKKGDADLWVASKTHLQGFPGMVWDTGDSFLPGVYVPRNTENPGWVAPELPLGINEPLQLALNLAKELKDYKAQVACYKLLIFQSQDPTQLFQELAHLQKSIQGDKRGHLQTLLFSYLVCKDRPDKERLLHELEQTDDWGDETELRDGLTYLARDFIERAVKRSLQGPKSKARLRNPASFYMNRGLTLEAERFTWQNTEIHQPPPARDHPTVTYTRQEPVVPSRRPVQVHGKQSINPYLRPPSPYRGHVPRPYPPPQPPTNTRGVEVYVDRRGQETAERRQDEEELARLRRELQALRDEEELARATEELQALKEKEDLLRAKKELQALREKETRDVRDQHDRETRERLKEAEQRLRDQEFINAKQIEEMKRREEEMKRLEQDFQRTKERQEFEARARQERETRERLERAELSLRDQAERLRRAEDRSHHDWLTDRDHRRRANTRKLGRKRGGSQYRTMSSASSDSYFSDSSPSRDDESSSDDTSLRTKPRDTAMGSDSEDEPERETRVNRRVRSDYYEHGSDQRRDEADHHDGDDAENHQQNSCTDLILYREPQDLRPPHAAMPETPILRRPTSPISQPDEARDEIPSLEQTDRLTAEPQEVEDQPDRPESAVSRSDTGETGETGPSSVRGSEFRRRNELRSKEQNERIANRPSRPTSTSVYVSPRPSPDESTGIWDAWEETKRKKAQRRRVVIDPGSSGIHTTSATPRSRPSSTQVYDDIQPLGRRTSWRDSPAGSPHGDRLKSPTKRRSLIIDADGRPQPVRTTSENHHSYHGESPRATHVRVIRSDVANGGRPIPIPTPIPQIPPAAAGSRSRPHSTGGIGGTRLHPPTGSERSAPERLPADSWERGQDGFWVKKKPSTLHEDPEEEEAEGPSQPQTQSSKGESSKDQDSLDPEQGVSRKSTVTDPEPNEE